MYTSQTFPAQKLPFSRKTKPWRKSNVDWADRKSYIWNEGVRKSYYSKRINYDLWNGKVHVEDMKYYVNPYNDPNYYIPDQIQHYPIINDLLGVLIGEEYNKKFDFFVRVSNFDAISSKENEMKSQIQGRLLSLMQQEMEPQQMQEEVKKMARYFKYEYQDIREIRANYLLNHYIKELDFKIKTNEGFKDALIASEEMYMFDIVGNEPVMEKLNPKKAHVLRNSKSSRVEDADIIIYEDYWSPGKILDHYHDVFKDKDVTELEKISVGNSGDGMKNVSETDNWVRTPDEFTMEGFIAEAELGNGYQDDQGNIRVLRVFWKSKRKVQKVKSYDQVTGEESFDYKDENYIVDKTLGEEVTVEWINEAWEGTKIGEKIYVNMRPRRVQYNRLSNPSRCHFGIIGQIYNTNQAAGVSLLDRMKPTAYTYDLVYDKLIKTLAKDGGTAIEVDLAKIPEKIGIEQWLYFLRKDGVAFVDSFNEGQRGAATGKLAGTMNTTGKQLNFSQATEIQNLSNLLIYLKSSLQDLSGISEQRKGSMSASETASGIERSVVQSSHITQELFAIHDNLKKRLLETLLETAKIALKGNKKKMQYIGDDYSNQLFEIDGDEIAECDHGIIVDQDSSNTQLEQKIESLAHAWSQNDTVKPSTVIKLMKGTSLSKSLRDVEIDQQEKKQQEQDQFQSQQEIQQQQIQLQEQQLQAQIQRESDKFDREMELNKYKIDLDNQTKISVAAMSALPEDEDPSLELAKFNQSQKELESKISLEERKLDESIRSNKASETIAKSNKNNKQ